MTDQNQGSIAYIFSTESRILMCFSFTFVTGYAIFEFSHMRREIVSIVRICMICKGIDQTYIYCIFLDQPIIDIFLRT